MKQITKPDKYIPRTDCVGITGKLPDDPDQIPITPPHGLIWMVGGALQGECGSYGIADLRVTYNSRSMDFTMTLPDALLLRELLDQTIEAMREAGDDEDTQAHVRKPRS